MSSPLCSWMFPAMLQVTHSLSHFAKAESAIREASPVLPPMPLPLVGTWLQDSPGAGPTLTGSGLNPKPFLMSQQQHQGPRCKGVPLIWSPCVPKPQGGQPPMQRSTPPQLTPQHLKAGLVPARHHVVSISIKNLSRSPQWHQVAMGTTMRKHLVHTRSASTHSSIPWP